MPHFQKCPSPGWWRSGEIPEEMRFVALREQVAPEFVRDEVTSGRAIIPASIKQPVLEPKIIAYARSSHQTAGM